jgi:hypothetical protein
MSAEQFVNNAQTATTQSLDNVSNPITFSVASVAAFPSSGQFRILIDSEILLVTSVNAVSNQFTAARAQEGTTIASHSNGATVTQVLTAQGLRNAVGGVRAVAGTSDTIGAADRDALVTYNNASAVAVTLTQPGTTGMDDHWACEVENRGAGVVTLTPTSSTIDGASSLALNQNQGCRIFTDGTNFFTQRGIGSPGTVTSVGLSMPAEFSVANSPVTSSGTLTVSKANQNANVVYAGPSSGSAAAPAFRDLVVNDLPTVDIPHGGTGQTGATAGFNALSPLTTKGDVLSEDGTNNVRVAGNTSTTRKFLRQTGDGTNSALPAWDTLQSGDLPAGTGTVTSVGLSAPSELSVSGSPVTTSGTLTLSKANQSANTVWAGPSSGSAAAPTFRGLVVNDLPTVNIAHGGTGQTGATAGFNALSPLTTKGDILSEDGTNNVRVAGNTSTTRKFLRQTGDGTNSALPAWDTLQSGDLPAGTGTVTSVGLSAPSELSVSGSPVTASGTLTLSKANQSANTVWAGPSSGSAAARTCRPGFLRAGRQEAIYPARIRTRPSPASTRRAGQRHSRMVPLAMVSGSIAITRPSRARPHRSAPSPVASPSPAARR